MIDENIHCRTEENLITNLRQTKKSIPIYQNRPHLSSTYRLPSSKAQHQRVSSNKKSIQSAKSINIASTQNQNLKKESINIQDQLDNIIQLKKENHKLGQSTINKIESKCRKEHLILELRKECEYYEMEEKKKEEVLNVLKILREVGEKNKEGVKGYYDDVRDRLKSFVKKVEEYDAQIAQLKEKKKQLKKVNDSILTSKISDKKKLEDQVKALDSKIVGQQSELEEIDKKFAELTKQKEDEKKKLTEQEAMDTMKYNTLFKKYKDLLTKYNVYEQEETEHNNEISAMKANFSNNLIKEDLNIKLTEVKLKNDVLQKQLDEINAKISKYNLEEEEREKKRFFLGKKKVEKANQKKNSTTGTMNSAYMPTGVSIRHSTVYTTNK